MLIEKIFQTAQYLFLSRETCFKHANHAKYGQTVSEEEKMWTQLELTTKVERHLIR